VSDFADPRCRGDFPSEEGELLPLLDHVLQRAGAGDQEALGLLLAIQSLIVPLDALRRSPWPERRRRSQRLNAYITRPMLCPRQSS
jgi:hypothetical protein